MKHLLITKFALRFPENHSRRKWERREGWLDYRLGLFRKYTLPSVQAQTFQDFEWWFLVDPSYPGLNKSRILELQRYGTILWMFAPWGDTQPEVGDILRYRYKDEWVCSTNLDSDDIIRNDFMERVHEQVTEEETWITFENGYMLKGDKIAPRIFERNPFISYVEYAAPFKSVCRIDHMQVRNQACAYKNLKEVPGWIQVDHSDNVKNLVEKRIRDFEDKTIDPSPIYENFTWRRS